MKYFKLLFLLIVCALFFYALNTKLGSIPPLGPFLSPAQGIWQNEQSLPAATQLSIPDLKEEVVIHYDESLIPHIFAENKQDLYRAQGYVTAQHRLWQMEFQTHAAAGRVAEIVGSRALDYDRMQRRKGMDFGAEQVINKMSEEENMILFLEAYRDGVNAYIDQLSPGDYPVEYKILDYAPEHWTTHKTALLLMYMTDMLAGREDDLENTNALKKLGRERFDL